MFDHVKFGVTDYAASKAFFLAALGPLGVAVLSEGSPTYGVELCAKGTAASLCLYQTEEKPAHLHLAFTAENRRQVEAFHRAALEAGGIDNGAPGLRPHYHANYYAAFVIGPDGHNIEVVCHASEASSSLPLTATSPRSPDHYMRVLVDRVPSMLAYWDKDLRCRFANRAYERWFGVDPEALIGTSIRDLLGPELFGMNEPHIRAALAGEQQMFERIVPGPDGVRRHSLATYLPEIVDGQVLGFFVQVTEVTQLREVESALAREQALRAQVEADAVKLGELLRERSEMLYVLAHEVRQPLNNAMAALQGAAIALAATDALAADPLASAKSVLGQVASRLDNTLAVASLLARADPIERQDVDVGLLIAVVVADLPAAEQPRIVVDQRSAARTASMDLGLMRLALRNVLSNALRHGPKGSPVTIRLTDSDDPLALLIDVVDQGPGVEAELMPRLFERGAHGREADRRARQGLGLYIVRRVMELHGGLAMVAANAPGEFSVRLVLDQT